MSWRADLHSPLYCEQCVAHSTRRLCEPFASKWVGYWPLCFPMRCCYEDFYATSRLAMKKVRLAHACHCACAITQQPQLIELIVWTEEWIGYAYASGFLLSESLRSILVNQHWMQAVLGGMRMRSAVRQLVFDKAMQLRISSCTCVVHQLLCSPTAY